MLVTWIANCASYSVPPLQQHLDKPGGDEPRGPCHAYYLPCHRHLNSHFWVWSCSGCWCCASLASPSPAFLSCSGYWGAFSFAKSAGELVCYLPTVSDFSPIYAVSTFIVLPALVGYTTGSFHSSFGAPSPTFSMNGAVDEEAYATVEIRPHGWCKHNLTFRFLSFDDAIELH